MSAKAMVLKRHIIGDIVGDLLTIFKYFISDSTTCEIYRKPNIEIANKD